MNTISSGFKGKPFGSGGKKKSKSKKKNNLSLDSKNVTIDIFKKPQFLEDNLNKFKPSHSYAEGFGLKSKNSLRRRSYLSDGDEVRFSEREVGMSGYSEEEKSRYENNLHEINFTQENANNVSVDSMNQRHPISGKYIHH